MYPPKHHIENDIDKNYQVIELYKFATLISRSSNDIFVTQIPLILDRSRGDKGFLIGHMDKNNPHVAHLESSSAFIVFNGPNAYISPKVYSSSQLPTWNSVSVHVRGKIKIKDSQDFVSSSLVNMTNQLEANDNPYILDSGNPRMRKWLNLIVGFEIEIQELVGRFKLSQDKNPLDFKLASMQLIEQNKSSYESLIKILK